MKKIHFSLGYVHPFTTQRRAACSMINPAYSTEVFDKGVTCKRCRKAKRLSQADKKKCRDDAYEMISKLSQKDFKNLEKCFSKEIKGK